MKIQFVKQHDSMQCGVACLSMICRYYGKTYTQNTLSRYCKPTSEGVSLKGLTDAAKTLGLQTASVRLTLEQLTQIERPCILHWNQNHFVVLYKVNKARKYYIADPGKGLLSYSREEFEKNWICITMDQELQGIAMLLEPTASFYEHPDEAMAPRQTFSFLWKYIAHCRKAFIKVILCLLAGSALQLLLPFLTQSIVDVGIESKDVGFIWLVLLGQFTITFSRAIMDFVRRWLLLHISMQVNISLVSDFLSKLLQLPMYFFDTKQMGDLMQRMGDHSRVDSFLTQQSLNITFSMISFIVFGCVLCVYNRLIFLIFLAGSMLYGGWIVLFLHKRKVLDYELFEQQAINSNKTYQLVTSMQEIKLQGCEQRRRNEWKDVQACLYKVQMKSLKLRQAQEAGSILINEVKNAVITVVSATAVINGSLTLGMMLAVQYIIGQLNGPIDQLMGFVYSLQDVKISMERINEIHDSDNEDDQSRTRAAFENDSLGISVNGLCFKYDIHALDNTLEDISFHIPQGKVTAIVGASGSGKTTLVKLLLGYYSPTAGEIELEGRNLAEYNLKWWRRQCGVVMQDGVIFSESIAHNIAVSDDYIDMERLEHAAKMANVKDYIELLPLKYNTIIGRDGAGLSQGQKQRILIARAVYKDPDFIFLDEATNSLDAQNERMIVENLNTFFKGRTVVVVAHRLSTVKHAHQIIVLDRGRVVETGNHETLTARHGAYYNLV
ncbi:MAG: peptidase domain-containing ABC transporter, partial [Bacteroidales bacterium]|nr:peptidase domain-containing ABC transporter [Candidatus Minthousia equi]